MAEPRHRAAAQRLGRRSSAGERPSTSPASRTTTAPGADAPDPDAALAGVPPGDFTLLLAHEPRQVAPGRGVDLQLSGHTHGGQLWPYGYLVRTEQPTLAGLDLVDGVPVVTSPGVGTWGPPVRVGARPEVSLVVLRAG